MQAEVRNTLGERLDYTFHAGSTTTPTRAVGNSPVVLIGHGVTGNKDRPFIVTLAEGLAAAGVDTIRMSFSGNGDSEGRFQDSTISKEVEDLGAMIDAIGNRPLCFVGHSMGGAVGVLRASQDQRIRWLVSLSGMVHARAFAEREFGDVTPDAGCMWEEESCPLSQTYVDDMAAIDSVVDLGSKISGPWLLVQGSDDDVVPPQDAQDIVARAGDNAELVMVPGSDHVFNGAATPTMVRTVVDWVSQQTKS